VASWYGEQFHGRTTSSGEVYDMEGMTAAHRTLPFSTVVRVENLTNGRSTTLRINDRGPFVDGRIIDLSRWGARELEMLGAGIAQVQVTVIGLP
jgi:rare lipoprotein A